MHDADRLRLLPAVDRVLAQPELDAWRGRLSHDQVRRAVQESVDSLRERLRSNGGNEGPADRESALEVATRDAEARLAARFNPSLRRVLNATGVVLHTNLGRAPLSEAAIAAVIQVARSYVNLEYDLSAGQRASRMDHVAELLASLCGAEAAFAVNNNAAAVLLAIDTLGEAGVVVSRGEQVEIGDSFRLPDILARAKVPIREIGTTNRTGPEDYEAAAVPGCVLLKVHRSNFALHGFVREAGIAELAAVARRTRSTVVYDLGAGCLEGFDRYGLAGEPDVRSALADGADVVTMSGDKLLGGPQAGLIAGGRAVVTAMRRNPLARALRIDKLTLAALQATLLSYASMDGAERTLPTLRLILAPPADIEARARRLLARLGRSHVARFDCGPSRASVGGGAFADLELPSFEVRVQPKSVRATVMMARLRQGDPAIVARIKDDVVGFDLRCIGDDEVELLAVAIERVLAAGGGDA